MNTRQFFTVWRFKSVDGKQTATVVKAAESNDIQVQHEYQKVLGQTLAFSKLEALAIITAQIAK